MSRAAIDRILAERGNTSSTPPGNEAEQEEKFFSILSADGLNEEFLELRMRNGDITCFSYNDLNWFHWDAEENCIDLDFGSAMVIVKGRGLVPKLFQGIKWKRVAWVREADSEMQDHKGVDAYISEIKIFPANLEAEAETQA